MTPVKSGWGWSAVALFVLIGCQAAVSTKDDSPPTTGDRGTGSPKGVDISEAYYAASRGVVFKDTDGTAKPPLQIFADHGYTWARVRLMVALPAADNYGLLQDLDYVKAAALDVRAKGMKFLLNLHYSDYWADPAVQDTPAAWTALTLDQLVAQVRTYSQTVMAALVAQGTPPDMVQIGNETNGGMLWPLGKIATAGWAAYARLQAAGAAGIEAGRGTATRPVILVHIAKTATTASAVVSWFKTLLSSGGTFDAIGLSYYPMWHGSQTLLGDTIRALRADSTLGSKPVWLVETAYYWVTNAEGYSGVASLPYPQTPAGQKAFLEATRATVTAAGGSGVFYWGACWTQPAAWITPAEAGWLAPQRRGLFNDSGVAQIGIDF